MNDSEGSERSVEEQLRALENSFRADGAQLLTAIVALAEAQFKNGRRGNVRPIVDRLLAFQIDHAGATSISLAFSYVSVASGCLREKSRDLAADLLKGCIPLLWGILEDQRNDQAAIFTVQASRCLSQGQLGIAKNFCFNAVISLSPGEGEEYARYRSPSDAPFHPPEIGMLRNDVVKVEVPAQYARIVEDFDAEVRKLPNPNNVRGGPRTPLSPRSLPTHTMQLHSFTTIYPARPLDMRRRTAHFTLYFAPERKVYSANKNPTHMFASSWADRFEFDGQIASIDITAGTAKGHTFSKIPPGPFTRRAEFDAAEYLASALRWRKTYTDVPRQYVEEGKRQLEQANTLPSIVSGPPVESDWMVTEVPDNFLDKFDDFLFDSRFHRKFNFFLPVLNLILEQVGFKIRRRFPF